MNVVSTLLWCLLFRDTRAAASLTVGIMISLAMTVDTNVHTRHLSLSLYVLGPLAIFAVIILVFTRLPADLHYITYHVRDVAIHLVDLMANVNLTVNYFMMARGLLSWRLVFSRQALTSVRCDVFAPICRLRLRGAPGARSQLEDTSAASPVTASTIIQMRLVRPEGGQAFDLTEFLLPPVARLLPRILPVWVLHSLGVVGLACSTAAVIFKVAAVHFTTELGGSTSAALTIVGFVATLIFVVIHATHFQPKLAKKVLMEVGAWYMALQISSTTICVCDAVQWQPLGVLLFLTFWLWGHWMIFLDVLPQPTRYRLRISRRLIIVATVLYPMLLGYYVYYSPARPFLRNRVVFKIPLGDTMMRLETFGFLASKPFMLSVWMLRSLWRELVRPVDSFKLIKLSVYYDVTGV